jgi:hypothetical protein
MKVPALEFDQGEVQTHEVLEDDVPEEYTDEDSFTLLQRRCLNPTSRVNSIGLVTMGAILRLAPARKG